MKKSVSVISLALVAVMMAFALTACLGGISGKYVNKAEAFGVSVETSYEFEGDSYTYTAVGVSTSGKFAVEEDKIYFWDEDATREDALGVPFNKGNDDKGGYVEIAGVKYYKQ